jgi:hypothetical protein
VIYQAQDAPEKEWRGWFTDKDTEASLEQRARNVLGILGSWRRYAYWRDSVGIRLVMTNGKKTVQLRYHTGLDPSIKEVTIMEDDTPKIVLAKLNLKDNFFITDSNGNPFADEDSLFGYCTFERNPPVQVLHGSALRTRKTRELTKEKDNRTKTIIAMGDKGMTFERGVQTTYTQALREGCEANNLPETWQIERVREEEDRMIVECADGVDASWFTEKACRPLRLTEDKIYQDATRAPPGGWGKAVPSSPIAMLTRAKAAAAEKRMKKVQVILQNITSGEAFNLGEADRYEKALGLAKKSGNVPKGWNVAVSDANDERKVQSREAKELSQRLLLRNQRPKQ